MRASIVLCWVLLAGSSTAADRWLRAQLRLERGSVFVGEPFNVWIRAVGNVRPKRPDTSQVRDFEVRYLGRKVRPSVGETLFAFRFVPTRIGSLSIPPLTVEGAGTWTKTPKARVEVVSHPRRDSSVLSVAVGDTRCFAGQQVVATVDFEMPESTRGTPVFYLPFLDDKKLKSILLSAGTPSTLPEGRRRIKINGKSATADMIESATSVSFRFQLVVIPEKTGTINLGVASVKMWPPRSGDAARTFTTTSVGTIDVNPLPPAPSSFSGLVGLYELSAHAEPRNLKVGDPTTLEVRISGQPYMRDVAVPAIEEARSLVRDFKVERMPGALTVGGASKVFHYRLRPKRDDVRLIPPLELTLFDPLEAQFVSRSTRAIPLKVIATKVVTAADAEGPPLLEPPPIARPDEGPSEHGAGRTVAELLASSKQTIDEMAQSRFWRMVFLALLVLSFAPVGYRVVWRVWAAWSTRTRNETTPFEEFREAMEDSSPASGTIELEIGPEFNAVRRYLRRKLRLTTSTPTFSDLKTPLEDAGASAESIESVQGLFDAEDAVRYGALQDPLRVNRATVERLVARLEIEIRAHAPSKSAGLVKRPPPAGF